MAGVAVGRCGSMVVRCFLDGIAWEGEHGCVIICGYKKI